MAVCAPALWLTPVPARSARELDRRVDSIPVNAERFLWPRGCPEARVMRAEPSPPRVPLRSARAAVWGPVYLSPASVAGRQVPPYHCVPQASAVPRVTFDSACGPQLHGHTRPRRLPRRAHSVPGTEVSRAFVNLVARQGRAGGRLGPAGERRGIALVLLNARRCFIFRTCVSGVNRRGARGRGGGSGLDAARGAEGPVIARVWSPLPAPLWGCPSQAPGCQH